MNGGKRKSKRGKTAKKLLKLPLVFSCLGFATAQVFVQKGQEHFHIGDIRQMGDGNFHFLPLPKEAIELPPREIPAMKQVADTYHKEFEQKGVSINRSIVYAG